MREPGKPILVIRRSCLTGRAVWVYRGPSKAAAASAYYRACEKEIRRFRQRKRAAEKVRARIMELLGECLAGQPPSGELPPEKRAAARQLKAIADNLPAYDRTFYDHVMEERRRRARDRRIRQQMREREAAERAAAEIEPNGNYDK